MNKYILHWWINEYNPKSPGTKSHLWFVVAQDLISLDQVQFAVTLLEHVWTRKPSSRRHQRLLHAGWVYDLLPMQDTARQQSYSTGYDGRRYARSWQRSTTTFKVRATYGWAIRYDVGFHTTITWKWDI